jgi:hypothetical protein
MRKLTFPFALLVAGAIQGCSAGPQFFGHKDPNSCHEPGSDAWWAEKAALPPGVRQECKKGKVWPARPRSNQEPQQFSHTFYAEHYWPLPYVCQDRESVRVLMETQTSLGWQEETTLYDRHFDPITEQLTRAGELHLQYILHVVPPERRAVYIQSTYDVALDGLRSESVNNVLNRTSQSGGDISVTVRDCQQIGRPAAEVQQINTMYNSSMPSPRLGSASSSGGSGGSGASLGGP